MEEFPAQSLLVVSGLQTRWKNVLTDPQNVSNRHVVGAFCSLDLYVNGTLDWYGCSQAPVAFPLQSSQATGMFSGIGAKFSQTQSPYPSPYPSPSQQKHPQGNHPQITSIPSSDTYFVLRIT